QTWSSGHSCKYRSAHARRQSGGYSSNPEHVRNAVNVGLSVHLSVGITLPSFVGHPHIPRSVTSSLTAEATLHSPLRYHRIHPRNRAFSHHRQEIHNYCCP